MPNCRYPFCLGAVFCCANQQRAAGINRGLGLGKTPFAHNHITRGFCRRRDQVVGRLLDLDGVIIANLDRRRVRKPRISSMLMMILSPLARVASLN
jgi:hypothetical protein